jgi:4-amino-4-deoxy-L-arabinose transferase-like glycosyltransferase
MGGTARILRWLCIVLAVAFVTLWIIIAYMRLVYPYEVEWMEGAMLDHAVRITQGKPIYTAPSIDFVAWLYPPLYYYAIAGAMKIVGIGFFAGRLVSIVSTILTAAMLGVMTKKITADKLLAFFTCALYLATYHATGFYFDIARNDAFFTCLLVVTAFVASSPVAAAFRLRPRIAAKDGYFSEGLSMAGPIATAIILALAIATKQQAIFFLPALAVWYWLRDNRAAIVFAATTIGLVGIAFLLTNSATNGWLAYYILRIPQAKRADFVWIRMFAVFPQYVFGAFTASTLALFLLLARAGQAQRAFWSSPTGLLALMACCALAAGAVSLGNDGGYANVMMPFAAFAIPLMPIAMSKLARDRPNLKRYIYLPILFQFMAFYFNPLSEKMLIASARQRHGGDEFFRQLRAISGDIFIPYHGFIASQAGKPTHAHMLASLDVLLMHDTTASRLQADMDTALARHKFSAVILEESSVFPLDSVAHYAYTRRMLAEPNVYLTRVASEATRPEFVFLPW